MSTINFKNTKVYFTSKGKGSTLVFLHGFLENLSMWKSISPFFTKNHRVICIDLLGHGRTGNLGYIHTMEEQAEMIKSVLDHLKLRKYILIGHSMGGYVSLAFAELFPNNINGFCLMNSTALSDTGEKKKNRDRAVKAVKHNLKTFVRMAIPNLFSEKNRTLFIDEIKIITQEALQISKQGIIASLEGMKIRKDRTFLLNSTKFPILMIISKMDPVLDYNSLLAQVQKSKAEFVELTDGHMSHIENKEEFISAIKKFVK